MPLGINTHVVDRIVVTQSRNAIEVHDPLKLIAWIETMLGTSGLADQIREADKTADTTTDLIREAEDQTERLDARR